MADTFGGCHLFSGYLHYTLAPKTASDLAAHNEKILRFAPLQGDAVPRHQGDGDCPLDALLELYSADAVIVSCTAQLAHAHIVAQA